MLLAQELDLLLYSLCGQPDSSQAGIRHRSTSIPCCSGSGRSPSKSDRARRWSSRGIPMDARHCRPVRVSRGHRTLTVTRPGSFRSSLAGWLAGSTKRSSFTCSPAHEASERLPLELQVAARCKLQLVVSCSVAGDYLQSGARFGLP